MCVTTLVFLMKCTSFKASILFISETPLEKVGTPVGYTFTDVNDHNVQVERY